MTQIMKVGETFSDTTLPKLYRDKMINSGTLFLFDFLNSYCNPEADGLLATSAVFNSLVDGGAVAGMSATNTEFSNITGKAGIACTGSSTGQYISIGSASQFDLSSSSDEFVVIIWIKTPSSGYNAGAYISLAYLGNGTTNNNQWMFDMGADGKTPRATVSNGTSGTTITGTSGMGLGAVSQLALHYKKTGLLELYFNGAVRASTTSAPTALFGVSATPKIFGSYIGNIYRISQEDLTVSGQNAAAQILADYNANVGRFA